MHMYLILTRSPIKAFKKYLESILERSLIKVEFCSDIWNELKV